jgi:hypothetical protein
VTTPVNNYRKTALPQIRMETVQFVRMVTMLKQEFALRMLMLEEVMRKTPTVLNGATLMVPRSGGLPSELAAERSANAVMKVTTWMKITIALNFPKTVLLLNLMEHAPNAPKDTKSKTDIVLNVTLKKNLKITVPSTDTSKKSRRNGTLTQLKDV